MNIFNFLTEIKISLPSSEHLDAIAEAMLVTRELAVLSFYDYVEAKKVHRCMQPRWAKVEDCFEQTTEEIFNGKPSNLRTYQKSWFIYLIGETMKKMGAKPEDLYRLIDKEELENAKYEVIRRPRHTMRREYSSYTKDIEQIVDGFVQEFGNALIQIFKEKGLIDDTDIDQDSTCRKKRTKKMDKYFNVDNLKKKYVSMEDAQEKICSLYKIFSQVEIHQKRFVVRLIFIIAQEMRIIDPEKITPIAIDHILGAKIGLHKYTINGDKFGANDSANKSRIKATGDKIKWSELDIEEQHKTVYCDTAGALTAMRQHLKL